jgi:hypothetical protein
MKCVSLAPALLCVVSIVFSGLVQAQVSFLPPATFPDCSNGTLFVADVNGDGNPDLLCSSGVVDLGKGDGTFKAGTPFPGVALAVADFNGDGKPDLLEGGTNTFSVLLGKGDGTFQSPVNIPAGGTLGIVGASDLNGDGYADVVGTVGATLYVFISNGDGTFKSGVPYALGTSSTFSGTLSFADFNNDFNQDIALNIYAGGVSGQVVVLLGNGDGTFQAPKTSAGVPSTPAVTAARDFNGDGNFDLAVSVSCSDCTSPPSVYIQLGNGDGTFQAPVAVFSENGRFAAADVNGDGILDLVFAGGVPTDRSSGTVLQIYHGNGDGTFAAPSSYVSNFPADPAKPVDGSVVIADFNLDGNLDIASSGGILLGNGDGTFQGLPVTTFSSQPVYAAVGDFERSGKPDVAVLTSAQSGSQTSYLYILHNSGAGKLSLLNTYALPAPGLQILVGDVNGDGNLDLVVIQTAPPSGNPGYSVLLGNGDGSFRSPVFYPESQGFGVATLVDVNNDKKLDLIEAGGLSSAVGVSLGNGDGTFTTTTTYDALKSSGSTLITGDFSGHGKVDIGVSPPHGIPGTVMLYGNGDGTFQPALIPIDLKTYTASATADFRNTGKADLFNGNQVALNNGDGTFTLQPLLKYSGGFPVADINGDGKVDLLFSNVLPQGQQGCQTAVELGNGDGTFGSLMNVPVSGCYPFSPSYPIADMDGDGRPDIVFFWGPGIGVLLNTSGPAPGFSIGAASPTSQTITTGQTASFSVAFAATASFSGTINLTCAITPAVTPAPTCSLSSSSVQIPGSGTQPVTVQVATAAPVTTGAVPRVNFPIEPMSPAWTLMFLGSAWLWVRNRKRLPALAAPIVVLAFAFSVGCGGSSSSSSTSHTTPGTPAGTYTTTITATSGSTTQKMALQVVVQ